MQSPELTSLLDSLPPALVRTIGYQDIATGAGYTQATFFGLIGFVLITIAGLAWGAAYTGAAEESGSLELTLAHGVGRVQYATEAAAAMTMKLLLLGAVAYVLVWIMNGPGQLGLDAGNLAAVTLAWVGLGLFTASAAFATGAASGRRSWALGAGAAVAVVGYVLQAVANNSEDLDGLRVFSPYCWAFGHRPLAEGWYAPGLVAVWAGSALLLGLATWALSRRDILG
jgi:ABC-2 type transport system permease protein